MVWGGPPATGPIDGTVVPSAVAGSLPFMPQAGMRVLTTIKNRYGESAWSRYGFVNAFNPLKNWYDSDVVGIDTGITLVMAVNARTGFVWETFMKNPEADTWHGSRRIQTSLACSESCHLIYHCDPPEVIQSSFLSGSLKFNAL